MNYVVYRSDDELYHHGVKGMRWGVRNAKDSIKKWSNTNWKNATKKQKAAAIGIGVGVGLSASFLLASGIAPNTPIGKLSTSAIETGRRYISNVIGSQNKPISYVTRNGKPQIIQTLNNGQTIRLPDTGRQVRSYW